METLLKASVVLLVCCPDLMGAIFPVEQGRFNFTNGFTTQNIRDHTAYTNYFAIRVENTNYIFLENHTGEFPTLDAGFAVTNDWFGGSGSWSTVTNHTRSVLHLSPGGTSFQLQFTNLWPGVYSVQLFGVVTNALADEWRKPLVWKIAVNDAADGTTNTYRLIQNYMTNRMYDVGQFWVQAIRNSGASNNLIATVSVDPSSDVNVKLVSMHFTAPVDWSETTNRKTIPTLYTALEQYSRTNFAMTNTAAGVVLDWKNNIPALPSTLTLAQKTNAFNRWPPINVMKDESLVSLNGTTDTNWVLSPHNANLQTYKTDYLQPFGFTNIVTAQTYSLLDFQTGVALPGTTNDFTGFHYSNSLWNATWGNSMSSLHFDYIPPMIMNTEGTSLPYRFYTFPNQTNAAHMAGIVMAKFALSYPTYRLESIDINSNVKNPSAYLGYDQGRWSLRRTGKWVYDGTAGSWQNDLGPTVDWLWPYVSNNQLFADDVTRFIPWVGGSSNNVKVLFEGLLRSLAYDNGYYARGGDPMKLGVVMQSGTVASNLMNPAESLIEVFPSVVASTAWKKAYAGSYNRDGVNLIGSSFYMVGEQVLLTGPDYTRRYKTNGGQVGAIDISNPVNFPKLGSYVNWFANACVGFGFHASFGDAGMSVNEGPGFENSADDAFLLGLWRLNPNARIGKYIYEQRGRSTQTDTEWTAMGVQAAATTLDLRYPTESRIFSGIGLGILEHGLGKTGQVQRGGIVLRTVGGSGHDHGDHLDLNIYSLGARMGTDIAQRNEGANVTYPRATATRVHNVVEVDGYRHEVNITDGWPGGDSEGGHSQYTAFSPVGAAQFLGAELWNNQSTHANVTHQSRQSALVMLDATNSYTVDFQRVHGGRFHSWSFHGADVGGETNSFTNSIPMTNSLIDFTSVAGMSPAYFMRKHATNAPYGIKQYAGLISNKVWGEWRLGRTATAAGGITNGDGNGGTVTAIAAEQAMYGSDYSAGSPRKTIRATLFDATNCMAGSAWLFSPIYSILQPRLYAFNSVGSNYADFGERSATFAALYDPYLSARVVTNETSLSTDSTLTNAYMPKAIEVKTDFVTDRHFSSGTNVLHTVGADTFSGMYAMTRDTNGTAKEWKLVGGTNLSHGGLTLSTATNRAAGHIASVNYLTFTITLSNAFAGVRRTGWHRILNANHETSYYITNWISSTQCMFSGDALVGELDVSGVSGDTITFTTAAGGMVLANYPKVGGGLTMLNEARSKACAVTYAASTTATRLSGDSIVTGDFTDADGDGHVSAWLYDFGTGDSLEAPSEVWLSRTDSQNYLVQANTQCTISGVPLNGAIYNNGWLPVFNGELNESHLNGSVQDFIFAFSSITPANIGLGRHRGKTSQIPTTP